MKNYIFCIVSAIIYVVLLVVLIRKAIHIFKNPAKYNEIKGWKEYRKSKWFELSERSFLYQKSLKSKEYRARMFVFNPMMIGLILLYYVISIIVQKVIFIPKETIMLDYKERHLGGIAAMILAFIICEWICLRSTKPVLRACSWIAFDGRSGSRQWKGMILAISIGLAACFPVMCAGVNSYAYATEKKISINEMLSIEEEEIFYSDIRYVMTSYRTNKDATEYYFSYELVMRDDEKIDLLSKCSNKNILEVHEYLQNSKVEMIKSSVSKEVYQDMKNRVKRKEIDLIDELFEVQ